MLQQVQKVTSGILSFSGKIACLCALLLLINVFIDVVMRYAFNNVSIGMQEMEWHLFAILFMLGIPYNMIKDGHVRVDILYESASEKRKAWVNLLGSLLMVLPFALVVLYYGIEFTQASFELGESSGDPGGLPYRWAIKAIIPLLGALLAIGAVNMFAHACLVLQGKDTYAQRDRACPS